MNTNGHTEQRKHSIIDFSRLENELAAEAKKIPTLEELGKAGAEAVNKQHEDTARQLENLGTEMRDHVDRLEDRIDQCHKDLKAISEVIAVVRDRGKSVELLITDAALFSQNVREIVEAVIRKVRE